MAQFGDACNVSGDLATLEQKFSVLKQHCEDVGRDYNSIHRTVGTFCIIGDTDEQAQASFPEALKARSGSIVNDSLVGTIDTIRNRIAAYEAVGVQELQLIFPDAVQLDSIRRFAKEFIA